MLNGLDLFSGIGGFSFALREYVRPVAYCEKDVYCQGVLVSRMANGDIGTAPIWDDITSFPMESFVGEVDIITGGFPCQDISIAGRGKGVEGERSGLFFEIIRLCKEIRPEFLFIENVPAITSRGGIRCVTEVASLGYDCRWLVLSAASVGAVHIRERWFLLAYSNSKYGSQGYGLPQSKKEKVSRINSPDEHKQWNHWKEGEPAMVGVDDGISNRPYRIKALGNAVVPEQAKEAFKILMGMKNGNG